MIRTRDFLLFATVLLFLIIGISSTIVGGASLASVQQYISIPFLVSNEEVPINLSDVADDRSAYIASLKEKIQNGEGQIVGGEAVLTSVDEGEAEDVEEASTREVLACNGMVRPSDLTLRWKPSEIRLIELGSVRLVVQTKNSEVTVGSSTVATTTRKTIMSLPVRVARDSQDVCIEESVVGITPAGALIDNAQSILYTSLSADTLVGYAFDGFPIYGVREDTTLLDACGGTQELNGYRYYLRADEPFVLGCYAGVPAQFSL